MRVCPCLPRLLKPALPQVAMRSCGFLLEYSSLGSFSGSPGLGFAFQRFVHGKLRSPMQPTFAIVLHLQVPGQVNMEDLLHFVASFGDIPADTRSDIKLSVASQPPIMAVEIIRAGPAALGVGRFSAGSTSLACASDFAGLETEKALFSRSSAVCIGLASSPQQAAFERAVSRDNYPAAAQAWRHPKHQAGIKMRRRACS